MSIEQRRSSPATQRNSDPILEVLRRILPASGQVLEVSAGAGEHAAFFSREFPELTWQPSDIDPVALESIEAWRSEGSETLQPPICLDVTDERWPVEDAAAVLCINMIHISPWEACKGLMRGAARILEEGGVLFLYGPYRIDAQHTAPSNEAFDESLRSRNPSWGVRDLEAVVQEAEGAGLRFVEKVAMPANNFSLVFRRSPVTG